MYYFLMIIVIIVFFKVIFRRGCKLYILNLFYLFVIFFFFFFLIRGRGVFIFLYIYEKDDFICCAMFGLSLSIQTYTYCLLGPASVL